MPVPHEAQISGQATQQRDHGLVVDGDHAGYTDHQIFGITVLVALRIALSTVNDALGVLPDAQLRSATPDAVLRAVTFGRPIADAGQESGK